MWGRHFLRATASQGRSGRHEEARLWYSLTTTGSQGPSRFLQTFTRSSVLTNVALGPQSFLGGTDRQRVAVVTDLCGIQEMRPRRGCFVFKTGLSLSA